MTARRPLGMQIASLSSLVALIMVGDGDGALAVGALLMGLSPPRWGWIRWVLGAVAATAAFVLMSANLTAVNVMVGALLVALHTWLREGRDPMERASLLVSALLWIAASVRADSPWMVALWLVWALAVPWALRDREPGGPKLSRWFAWRVGTATVAVAVVIFLALPRLGPDLPDPLTGVSESVTLGSFGELKDDPTPFGRVRGVPGDDGVALRVASFDRFDGTRWTPSEQAAPQGWTAQGPGVDVTVQHSPALGLMALPGGVVSWTSEPARPGPGGRWWAPKPGDVHAQVTVVLDAPVPPTVLSDDERRAALTLPEGLDPRVLTLAASFDQATPEARVDAVRDYLAASYTYARQGPSPGVDPLTAFLFDRRAGHCELFATGAAVLLRAQGVPARIATGFVGGERQDDAWLVRRSDAHAWTEAHLDGIGWVAVDATVQTQVAPATPHAGVPPVPPSTLGGSRPRWQLPAWLTGWQRSALAYGPRQQRWLLSRLAYPALAMLLAAVLVGLWRRPRRSQRQGGGRPFAGPRRGVAGSYDAARALLAAEGWHAPEHLPPVSAAAWMTSRVPWVGEAYERLAWLHAEVLFGGVDDATHAAEADACLEQLREAVPKESEGRL